MSPVRAHVRRGFVATGLAAAALLVAPSPAIGVGFDLAPPGFAEAARTGAQQQATDTVPEYRLPGLIVATRRATLSSGGASVIEFSLDPERIAPSPSLGEALRETPLVQIRTNSRGEEQPSLRGAGSRQVAVLFDGVPLTLGWDHRADLSIVPLQGATELRVHRGLSSLLFGPNILGGVVEISMSAGDGAAASRGRRNGGRLAGAWESGGGWRVDADAMNRLDAGLLDWTFRAGIGATRSPGDVLPGGIRDVPGLDESLLVGAGGLRLNSDLERIQGFLSARASGVDGGWGGLSISGLSTHRGVPPEAHTSEPRFWRYPAQDELLLVLSGGRDWEEGRWGPASLASTFGVQVGTTELESYSDERYHEAIERQHDDDLTTTLRVTGRVGDDDRGVVRGAFTFADVRHAEGPPGEPTERFQQRLWSVGTEVEMPLGSLGPATSPKLGAGLVWDGATTPRAGPWEPEAGLNAWGARAGVSALLGGSGDAVGHASVSRRVRFPSLREMYSGAFGRFLPNPELGPEVQLAGEAGVTLGTGWGELQGVAFVQNVDDGIVRVTVDQGEGAVLQRVNRDRVRSRGFEFLGSLRRGPVELEADLTLQRVRARGEGGGEATPEYEPAVQGSLTAATSVARLLPWASPGAAGASEGWRIEDPRMTASFRYVGSQHCLDPAAGGMERIGAAELVDVGLDVPVQVGARPFRGMSVGARVGNVTNALAFDQCGLPRPGRTLELTLRVR